MVEYNTTRRAVLAGGCAITTALSGCTLFSGDEKPAGGAWKMIGRDPGHTGYAPDAILWKGLLGGYTPSKQWSVSLGSGPSTAPIVADQKVFVTGQDIGIAAYGLAGNKQWTASRVGYYPAARRFTHIDAHMEIGRWWHPLVSGDCEWQHLCDRMVNTIVSGDTHCLSLNRRRPTAIFLQGENPAVNGGRESDGRRRSSVEIRPRSPIQPT